MALEDKPLPTDFVVDPDLAEAIQKYLVDGNLPCARAFALAEAQGVAPLLIGQTADVLQIHLTHCQLGLFGYPGHTKGWEVANLADHPVPPELPPAIQAALNDEGILTCPAAWEIAARLRVPKMLVAYVAGQMSIRVRGCQLGAF